ncbi:unnamed protein product [Ectocarpus sp. 13 AM-2016]
MNSTSLYLRTKLCFVSPLQRRTTPHVGAAPDPRRHKRRLVHLPNGGKTPTSTMAASLSTLPSPHKLKHLRELLLNPLETRKCPLLQGGENTTLFLKSLKQMNPLPPTQLTHRSPHAFYKPQQLSSSQRRQPRDRQPRFYPPRRH